MVPYADGRDAPMRIRTVDFPSWNLCETGLVIPGRISAEAPRLRCWSHAHFVVVRIRTERLRMLELRRLLRGEGLRVSKL